MSTINTEKSNGVSEGQADASIIGAAKQDADNFAKAGEGFDKARKSILLDRAETITPDSMGAYLDAFAGQLEHDGLTNGSARKTKAEAKAVFESYRLTAEIEGSNGLVKVEGKTALTSTGSYSEMVKLAQAIRRAVQTQSGTDKEGNAAKATQTGKVRALQDKVFDDVYEDLNTRMTPQQSLATLDLAITAISSRFPQLSVQCDKLRKIEEEMIAVLKDENDKMQANKASIGSDSVVKTVLENIAAQAAVTAPAPAEAEEVAA